MAAAKKRGGKASRRKAQPVDDRRRPLVVEVESERSARAALIRAAFERGELRSKESPQEALNRNKAYYSANLPPGEAAAALDAYVRRHQLASSAPEQSRHVGRPLKKAQGVIHFKHFVEKKLYPQCFDELYAESIAEFLSDPGDRKAREKSIITNVKAYEARLKEKRGGF